MTTIRKSFLILVAMMLPAVVSGAAHEVFDLEIDSSDSVSWQGKEGYIYFFQWSEDAKNWNFVPTIYAGTGTYIWEYSGTSVQLFCRILAVYLPSANPDSDDFDDDGISNIAELEFQHNGQSAQLNPLNPDSDGDGFSDGTEVALGMDPSSPDHATEWMGTIAVILTPTS